MVKRRLNLSSRRDAQSIVESLETFKDKYPKKSDMLDTYAFEARNDLARADSNRRYQQLVLRKPSLRKALSRKYSQSAQGLAENSSLTLKERGKVASKFGKRFSKDVSKSLKTKQIYSGTTRAAQGFLNSLNREAQQAQRNNLMLARAEAQRKRFAIMQAQRNRQRADVVPLTSDETAMSVHLDVLRRKNQETLIQQSSIMRRDAIQMQILQAERASSKSANILKPIPIPKINLNHISVDDNSILMTPNLFSNANSNNNIFRDNGRPNILQTSQSGNNLRFGADSFQTSNKKIKGEARPQIKVGW